jgi:hypothetical protein
VVIRARKDRGCPLAASFHYAGTPGVAYWPWRRTEMPRAVVWRAVIARTLKFLEWPHWSETKPTPTETRSGVSPGG